MKAVVIGAFNKLLMNACYGSVVGNHPPNNKFLKVLELRWVLKQMAKLTCQLVYGRRNFSNWQHSSALLRGTPEP